MGYVCVSLSPLDSDAHASPRSNKIHAVPVSVMGHGCHTESSLSREDVLGKCRAWEVSEGSHRQEREVGEGRGRGEGEEGRRREELT